MLFAAVEEGAEKAGFLTTYGFDILLLLFTITIAWGLVRLLRAEKKNKFAIGFSLISLAVFLFVDYLMVLNWFGKL
mgnify:CR=1 FL=1|jgi:flagellar biogenesis protein FliO